MNVSDEQFAELFKRLNTLSEQQYDAGFVYASGGIQTAISEVYRWKDKLPAPECEPRNGDRVEKKEGK